ncbi:hypothetical protein ACH419_32615 [Streptomyces bobili]|uniref:hypothetical protein n=1 Tax=Streptomyces bobili TaxID=67280 RepID=UPI00379C1036
MVNPDFLDVRGGLHLAQDGVVDAEFVTKFDHGAALVGDDGEPQCRVLLGVPQRGIGR